MDEEALDGYRDEIKPLYELVESSNLQRIRLLVHLKAVQKKHQIEEEERKKKRAEKQREEEEEDRRKQDQLMIEEANMKEVEEKQHNGEEEDRRKQLQQKDEEKKSREERLDDGDGERTDANSSSAPWSFSLSSLVGHCLGFTQTETEEDNSQSFSNAASSSLFGASEKLKVA